MCAFGLCAPDTGEPIKKSTRVITNSKEAARLLNIKCPGCESHRTFEGSIRHGGKTISLSEFCGGCTRDFVLTMLDGFMHDLLQPMNYLPMVVSKRNILDTLEDGAAERLLFPNPQKKGRTDYVHARRREHQEEEAQEVRRRAPCGFSGWPTTSESNEYTIDGQQLSFFLFRNEAKGRRDSSARVG